MNTVYQLVPFYNSSDEEIDANIRRAVAYQGVYDANWQMRDLPKSEIVTATRNLLDLMRKEFNGNQPCVKFVHEGRPVHIVFCGDNWHAFSVRTPGVTDAEVMDWADKVTERVHDERDVDSTSPDFPWAFIAEAKEYTYVYVPNEAEDDQS